MGAWSEERWRVGGEADGCVVHEGLVLVTLTTPRPNSIVTRLVDVLEDRRRTTGEVGPLRAVVDLRRSYFQPTTPEIHRGVIRLARLAPEGWVGLVVANDLQFGLARVFGALAEGPGFDVRPFRTAVDAARWLREIP